MGENDYILDANVVLRYLLKDNEEQFSEAKSFWHKSKRYDNGK